jgi:hypothetical protein
MYLLHREARARICTMFHLEGREREPITEVQRIVRANSAECRCEGIWVKNL